MKMFLAVVGLMVAALSASAGDGCRSASGLYRVSSFSTGGYAQQAPLSSYDLARLQQAQADAAFRAAQRQADLDALYATRFRAPAVYYSAPQVQGFNAPPVIVVDQRGQGRQHGFSGGFQRQQNVGGFGSGNFTRELFTGVNNLANSPAGLVAIGGLLGGAFR